MYKLIYRVISAIVLLALTFGSYTRIGASSEAVAIESMEIGPPAGYTWQLNFSDEFNGSSVDTTKWKIANDTRPDDSNKTFYRPENVSISDGVLKLTIKNEPITAVNYIGQTKTANFTGGMLESYSATSTDSKKFLLFQYGYYEARIKYHIIGCGFWTNFWLYGRPVGPAEFDMEIMSCTGDAGTTSRANQIRPAYHYLNKSGANEEDYKYSNLTYNDTWHTYGILWLPNQPIKYFIDGVEMYTPSVTALAADTWGGSPTSQMYITLRAGAYRARQTGGLPTASTIWPGYAEYDWVRTYSLIDEITTSTNTVVPSATPSSVSSITSTPSLLTNTQTAMPTSTIPAATPTSTPLPANEPSVSTIITPSSINAGAIATVNVNLNNIPVGGYTSAEFTCTYNPALLEASSIAVANLFGVDPLVAINGPQNGNFILAIAGTNGNRATVSGTAFTFSAKGLQAGQAVIECKARISKGDNILVDIPSTGVANLTIGSVPTATPTPTNLSTGSAPTTTPTPLPTFTSTPLPATPTAMPALTTPTATPTSTPLPANEPSVSTIVIPMSINVGNVATVNVNLNNIPVGGYTSAEFTCTYNPALMEASSIAVANLFGADPLAAINGPQNGSFILAVAGSNSNWATVSGTAFTFSAKGMQAGQAVIECKARVSKGDNILVDIPSTGGANLTIGSVPTVTPTPGNLSTKSAPTTTPTPLPTFTPTALPAPVITGQVLASKPVTIRLYNADNSLTATVNANPDGTFNFTAPDGTYTITAIASGFLSAQGSITLTNGNTRTMSIVTLPAGDIDGNGVIDQFDAMTIGMSYNTANPPAADLNNDGTINVLDLELPAANYRKAGAVAWQ